MRSMGKGAARALVILVAAAAAASCGLIDALLGTDLAGDGTPTEITGLSVAGTVSYGTAARDVVGDGSYAYVATYTYSGTYGGVSVVDVSNPSSPAKLGSYYPSTSSTSLYASFIAKSGDNVYIDGGSVRYFAKVGVATPSSPYRVFQYDGSNSLCSGLIADGNTLYYNSYHGGCIDIFDVSGTYAPGSRSGYYAPAGYSPGSGCAEDGYLYLRVGPTTLRSLRLNSTGTGLTEVGNVEFEADGTGQPVKSGTYIYQQTGSSLLVIDASDPASMAIVGSVAISRSGRLAVSQACAFIVSSGYIDLYDVGVPSSPSFITTTTDTAMSPSGVSTAGDVLLVSDGGGGSGKLRCYRMLK